MDGSTYDGHHIQPLGNLWLLSHRNGFHMDLRIRGLGTLHRISDRVLIEDLLEDGYLSVADCFNLGSVSRAWYVIFHAVDSIWRSLYLRMRLDLLPLIELERRLPDLSQISWRVLCLYQEGFVQGVSSTNRIKYIPSILTFRDAYYSDYLFHLKRCASHCVEELFLPIPEGEQRPSLDKSCRQIPELFSYHPQQFQSQCEAVNVPVVLRQFLKNHTMSGLSESFLQAYGSKDALFDTLETVDQRCHNRLECQIMDLTWKEYQAYLGAHKLHGERPLYLFEPHCLTGVDLKTPFFPDDYFSILEQRPQYRWLVIGPRGSGSSFHIDPNATSAWNLLLYGRKWWIMFPPDVTPPGIFPSPDGADVTAPTTLTEWLLNWCEAAREQKPLQCIAEAGDLVFVPSRWWHMVLNLEESACITQNYVGPHNIHSVLKFLRTNPRGITGLGGMEDDTLDEEHIIEARRSLCERFESSLRELHPTLKDYIKACEMQATEQSRKQIFGRKETKGCTELVGSTSLCDASREESISCGENVKKSKRPRTSLQHTFRSVEPFFF